MATAVRQFFANLALQLWEGRIGELTEAHSAPLVVALPGGEPGYVVLATPAQIEHFFRLNCEGLRRAGIPHLGVAVTGIKATAPDRLSAWVEWFYVTAEGARAGETTARYYLERRQGSFSVRMIEFERIASTALVDWIHAAGDPAEAPPVRLH